MSRELAAGAPLVLGLLHYIEQVEKLKIKPAFSVPDKPFAAYQQELNGLPELQFNLQVDGDDVWLGMPRPLLKFRISDLEEMFAERPTDSALLDRLQQELKYRKTRRAVTLLQKVKAAVPRVESKIPSSVQLSEQSTTSKPSITCVPSRDQGAEPLPLVFPVQETPRNPSQSWTGGQTFPPTDAGQAYALLKISPDSSWESVELARRKLVQRASPAITSSMSAGDRSRLSERAALINVAYALLAKQRCNGN